MNYRSDIDGLRAIAVVLVLLFHANLSMSGGFVGVDVFFVISGFLITKSISNALDKNEFSLITFYDHRVRRILPALIPVLLVTSIGLLFLMLPPDLEQYGKALASTGLFSSNVYFWRESGYFNTASALNPLLHTWSLGVEEQFYIFFPLLMSVLLPFAFKRRVAVLAGLTIFSFVASCWLLSQRPNFTFYMLPTRAWELLVGSLLSFVAAPRLSRVVSEVSSLVGLVAIFASAVLLHEGSSFPGVNALAPVLGSALMIYAGGNEQRGVVTSLLSLRPVRFIGLISYSLYLWHWPLLAAYRYYADRGPTPLEGAGLIGIAFVLAILSWRYVERPWRRRDAKTSVVLAPVVGLAAMAGVTVIGLMLWAGNGFPSRMSADVQKIAEASKSLPGYECVASKASDVQVSQLCGIGDPLTDKKWLLWGDSHGWALQSAYSAYLAERHLGGRVISVPGCPPLAYYDRVAFEGVNCKESGVAAMRYIRENGVTDVILSAYWTNWFVTHDDFIDKNSNGRSVAESTQVMRRAFAQTVSDLHKAGVRVWVQDPLPVARKAVPNTLAKEIYFGDRRSLTYSKAEYLARNQVVFETFDESASMISGRFAIGAELCKSGTCLVANDAGPLYADDNHPASFQSDFFKTLIQHSGRVE